MLRPATPLAFLLFVAFVLLLISTISAPIVRSISLAQFENVDFGVFGYCKGSACSRVVVGYSTDGLFPEKDGDFSLKNGRRPLSALLIVHPIATLLSLILLILAICAHLHSPSHSSRYLTCLLLLTLPTLLLALLAFLVDILLFTPHVAWGGWIVLAATLAIAASGIVTCAMRRTLVSRKARKRRIAENAEMSGENFYNREAAHDRALAMKGPPPLSAAPTVPSIDLAPPSANTLPSFATMDTMKEERIPLTNNAGPNGSSFDRYNPGRAPMPPGGRGFGMRDDYGPPNNSPYGPGPGSGRGLRFDSPGNGSPYGPGPSPGFGYGPGRGGPWGRGGPYRGGPNGMGGRGRGLGPGLAAGALMAGRGRGPPPGYQGRGGPGFGPGPGPYDRRSPSPGPYPNGYGRRSPTELPTTAREPSPPSGPVGNRASPPLPVGVTNLAHNEDRDGAFSPSSVYSEQEAYVPPRAAWDRSPTLAPFTGGGASGSAPNLSRSSPPPAKKHPVSGEYVDDIEPRFSSSTNALPTSLQAGSNRSQTALSDITGNNRLDEPTGGWKRSGPPGPPLPRPPGQLAALTTNSDNAAPRRYPNMGP